MSSSEQLPGFNNSRIDIQLSKIIPQFGVTHQSFLVVTNQATRSWE
jgi:hypothetical protein